MDRDDVNLKHFASRAQQTKALPKGPTVAAAERGTPPVNIYLVFDQGFGSELDNTRFRYVGTSPMLSQYEGMCGRRMCYDSMRLGFSY